MCIALLLRDGALVPVYMEKYNVAMSSSTWCHEVAVPRTHRVHHRCQLPLTETILWHLLLRDGGDRRSSHLEAVFDLQNTFMRMHSVTFNPDQKQLRFSLRSAAASFDTVS